MFHFFFFSAVHAFICLFHVRIQDFCQGGGGVQARWPENSLDNFVSPQLILQFTERDNGFISEKTILSQGSRGGPTFSRGGGGVHLFPGGGGVSKC